MDEALVDLYCSAWSEKDEAERLAVLGQSVSEACVYCDPSVQLFGAAALSDHIGAILARRPTSQVIRTGPVDWRNDVGRFEWAIEGLGPGAMTGIDFVQLDDARRLKTIFGYFGGAAAAATGDRPARSSGR